MIKEALKRSRTKNSVPVFGERLKLSRAKEGLSLRGLAAKIDHLVTAQAIGRYERGECVPSPKVFFELVKALDVESSFLLDSPRFNVHSIQFRKNASRKKKDVAKVEACIIESIHSYWIVESFLGINSHAWDKWSDFRRSIAHLSEAESSADELRALWRLGGESIAYLDEVLETKGIKILRTEIPNYDSLGASVFRDESNWVPVFLLKDHEPGERQRLALARELGHLLLEPAGKLNPVRMADRFARAFLLPGEAVQQYIGKKRNDVGWDELFDLKQIFGVPVSVVVIRCGELGIFSKPLSKRLIKECEKYGLKDVHSSEPGSWPSMQVRRYERMCSRAYAEQACSASRAGELLNIPSLELLSRMSLVRYRPYK